jgi:large subunit ribosomal protein L11
MAFCKEYNAATKDRPDSHPRGHGTRTSPSPLSQVATGFDPVEESCRRRHWLEAPNKEKVGKVTRKQVMEIVKLKQKDLNATNDEAAFRVVAGTARSMGIEVVG